MAALGEALDELLAQAGDDLGPGPVVQGEQQVDESDRGRPAEGAGSFDQPRVGPTPGGGDGGGDAGGAGAADDDVGCPDHR